MLVPTLSTASRALSANRPKPDPIDDASVNVAFQFAPLPLSEMGTAEPTGGTNDSVGGVPGWAGSVNVNEIATLVEFVVWIGPSGAVTMAPDGGVTSITSAGPDGPPPLDTFPARSCPETCNAARPDGVNCVTLYVPSNVFNPVLVRFNSVGELAPCGRIVRFGVPVMASFAVSVTRNAPGPTGTGLSKETVNEGGVAS